MCWLADDCYISAMIDLSERRQKVALILVVLIPLVVGWCCLFQGPATEEDRIWLVILEMRDDVIDKAPGPFMRNIADSYSDANGLNRQELYRFMVAWIFRSRRRPLSCVVVRDAIEIAEDRQHATVQMRAAIYRGLGVDQLTAPKDGQGFDMTINLEKDDGGYWKVTSHRRTPFPAEDLWHLTTGQ